MYYWHKIFLLILDIIGFYLSLLIALFLRGRLEGVASVFLHFYNFSILLPFFIITIKFLDLYKIHSFKSRIGLFLSISNSILYYFIFSILIFYIIPFFKITPKTILLLQSGVLLMILYYSRILLIKILENLNIKEYVLLLLPKSNKSKNNKFNKYKKLFGFKIITKKLNDSKNLEKLIKDKNINIVVTELPLTKSYLQKLCEISCFKDLTLMPDYKFIEKYFGKIDLELAPKEYIFENLIVKSPFYEFLKRLIDIIFGIFGMLIFILIFPIIYIAIKLEDGGRIFYIQKRVGYQNKIFNLYKFRTMIEKAQKYGPLTTQENDKRITKVGKILRKLHIDEIPQFINLLKGDLSLIGPRPEQPKISKIYEKEIPFYSFRTSVKPGIIGWAQINYGYAKNKAQTIEKLKYDLYYIKNRNLILDFEIILKVLSSIF